MNPNHQIKIWQSAAQARKDAEAWQNLPKGSKYNSNTKFDIFLAHCTAPELIRTGQQHGGGDNYWKTEAPFNQAILEYLVRDWPHHYPHILAILQKKEKEALQKCQTSINEMQALIDATKNPSQ